MFTRSQASNRYGFGMRSPVHGSRSISPYGGFVTPLSTTPRPNKDYDDAVRVFDPKTGQVTEIHPIQDLDSTYNDENSPANGRLC